MKKNLLVTILITSAISTAIVSCKKENAIVYPVNTTTNQLLTDTPYRHTNTIPDTPYRRTNTIIQDTPYLQATPSYTDTPYLRK
jgi:hypothetical protein